MEKQQLSAIRDAWATESLWFSPQDGMHFWGTDGYPIFLQACIKGQYMARFRLVSFDDTARLWAALESTIPPPKPMR
jgi:hypothetical protein